MFLVELHHPAAQIMPCARHPWEISSFGEVAASAIHYNFYGDNLLNSMKGVDSSI